MPVERERAAACTMCINLGSKSRRSCWRIRPEIHFLASGASLPAVYGTRRLFTVPLVSFPSILHITSLVDFIHIFKRCVLPKRQKQAYPRGDRKAPVEFGRCHLSVTRPKKRRRAKDAVERGRAYRKRSARLCYTRLPAAQETIGHPTRDVQKW